MFHEFAHALAALKCGDSTAKQAGRLSLNPMAHVDPMGMFFFFVSWFMGMGFGWAKPVPVNPLLFKNMKRGTIIVSIAGVAANFILILFAIIVLKVLVLSGQLNIIGASITPTSITSEYLLTFLLKFISLNTALVVFNLIPIPPLDGSKVLMALLPTKQAIAIARIEPYGMIILLIFLFTGAFGVIFSIAMSMVSQIADIILKL